MRTIAVALIMMVPGAVSAAGDPSRPEDEGRECARVLERCWQAVQPVFTLLKTSAGADRRSLYGRSEGFIQRCQQLPPGARRCLLQAEDVLAAFSSCQSPTLDLRLKLQPPRLTTLLRETPRPLTTRRARRLLARLAGYWRHEQGAARLAVHWRVNTAGEVEETWQGPFGRSKRRHFRLEYVAPQTVEVRLSENQMQTWKLLRLSKNRLLVDDSGWGSWARLGGRGDFAISDRGYLVVVRGGDCQVVEPRGRRHGCRLSWSGRRRRVLRVSWRPDGAGQAGSQRILEFLKIGRLLVGREVYRRGLFVKGNPAATAH